VGPPKAEERMRFRWQLHGQRAASKTALKSGDRIDPARRELEEHFTANDPIFSQYFRGRGSIEAPGARALASGAQAVWRRFSPVMN
jgi:hypothetical protein